MDIELAKQKTIYDFEVYLAQKDAILQAWHLFNDEKKLPSGHVIRPEILESWQRSVSYGLDPYNISPLPLPPRELAEIMSANQELIEATIPLFDAFAEQLRNSLFTLDLYDKNLCFIKTFGRQEDELATARKEYAKPGLRRDEKVCGTTAMSIAHYTKRPARLIGAEHFDKNIHDRVCTSVPIFDPSGELTGIINVVEHCLKTNERTLGTMIALSKGVEYNLLQMRNQKQLEISNDFNKAILETIEEAIIVVGADNRVSMANKAAYTLLSPPEGRFEGVSAEDLFGPENPFLRVLRTNKSITDKEIVLHIGDATKRCMGTIRPILSESSVVHGVIGTLKDMGSARKMMKTFGGWNAAFTFDNIIGKNPLLLQAVQLAEQTAALNSNTLIQGESGTGKEVFAQAIHNAGEFKKGPFVAVNCAAIPVGLLESELFGHEHGAYTGAKKNGQPGKFELAEGGTIFLDEINSMPLDIQAKILRVVQEKKITRVGGTTSITLHLKLIAACNANLWSLVSQGLFRSDLFYRLNVITIHIPPLRQRIDDLPYLVQNITGRLQASTGTPFQVTAGALDLLSQYTWPGNIRELENVLERGFVQASIRGSSTVDAVDFQMHLDAQNDEPVSHSAKASVFREAKSPEQDRTTDSQLKNSEKSVYQKALLDHHGNISKTAKALGVARNTLYRKIKDYGLVVPK